MTDEIQKKIYGQRQQQLTPLEINQLFQSDITNEFNMILYRGLQTESLDPDVALLQAILAANDRKYFIPIAMCLRFGADPNMYVESKLGNIHIIGYLYEVTDLPKDDEIINTILVMLLAKGARSNMRIFDQSSEKATVLQWISNQDYTSILPDINSNDPTLLSEQIGEDSAALLAIILDDPRFKGREFVADDFELAIYSFSTEVIKFIPIPNIIIMLDYKSLDVAIDAFNYDAYYYLITQDQFPSYLLLSKIIIAMREYLKYGKVLAYQELERMLLLSVAYGAQLDQELLTVISTISNNLFVAVRDEYNRPYWQKACRSPQNTISPKLQDLVNQLNIQKSSKAGICESLEEISKTDKDALIRAARERQRERLASQLNNPAYYMNNQAPMPTCRNRRMLQADPLDYGDLDLVVYNDDQNVTWCFSSDMFRSLLENKVNPYTGVPLPAALLQQIKFQLDTLDKMGYAVAITPKTYQDALNDMMAPDTLNNRSSEESIYNMVLIGAKYGVDVTVISTLTKERVNQALRAIDFTVELDLLSNTHALIIASKVLSVVDEGKQRRFFEVIKQPTITVSQTPPVTDILAPNYIITPPTTDFSMTPRPY